MQWLWVNVLLCLILVLSSCQCQKQPKQRKIKLFLASSLLAIKKDLEKIKPDNINFELNFASSSQIARQIENGAPCDLAILANKKWYTYLVNKKLAKNGADIWASNSLMLVSNNLQQKKISTQKILEESKKIIIADPEYVPLGEYTKQFLENIYLYKLFENKLVKTHSAANTFNLFEQKLGESAFLYKSDALRSKQAQVRVALPVNLYKPIIYPLFACPKKRAQYFEQAREFLFSAEIKKILEQAGFEVANW